MTRTPEQLLREPLAEVVAAFPMIGDFLDAHGISGAENAQDSLHALAVRIPEEELGTPHAEFFENFSVFLEAVLETQSENEIRTLEVTAGCDKSGAPENCSLVLKPGEVTCIVGPTGSGKSRLLADIEWLADRDTPTRRTVLLNGSRPDDSFKSAHGGKLVAQITQNMNFVLDMSVQDFLLMHAQSRYLEDAESKVREVIAAANELAGEPFAPDTPVTFLSGGQSRALMIADVAIIAQAPIVLIDEIENAGTDKRKALELLISREKIILMATHDPLLILQADRRVVIRNGGMADIIQTNEHEKQLLQQLEKMDAAMHEARAFFRAGKSMKSSEL